MEKPEVYRPQHHVRFVTAASLFDGHDAAINLIRRLLQAGGVEVVHLGHNRSVDEIVSAAIQEDVQGIAVSSYQGGHMEFFRYMVDLLKERGADHIQLFGGGGGVIIPREIRELEAYGVNRIFSPDDGRKMGLQGMINHMVKACDFPLERQGGWDQLPLDTSDFRAIARRITAREQAVGQQKEMRQHTGENNRIPVLGITGTGGAGKSSLTDELVQRFLEQYPDRTVAILSIDPSRQKTGGALLGDRIRMNAIHHPRVYMRSLATRKARSELSHATQSAVAVLQQTGFDLVIVETSGIGQGDSAIVDIADVSLYVMTSDFGAPSQLEKIEMLDMADAVAINKFDRRGSEDALREVRKQYKRNHHLFDIPDDELPVFATRANQFQDVGTSRLFRSLIALLNEKCDIRWELPPEPADSRQTGPIIPPNREHYLYEAAQTVRDYRAFCEEQVALAREWYQLDGTLRTLERRESEVPEQVIEHVRMETEAARQRLDPECRCLIETWPELKKRYEQNEFVTTVRGREIRTQTYTTSLAGTRIPKVALPRYEDWGDVLRWRLRENVPGSFPFTSGVFPFKREEEDPKRQFAGEGTPERTNRRFHYLSENDPAKRLSTAFDSVTLYGEDPDYRPDIYGKVGESGVSVCTQENMHQLFAGFDLCHPSTSVSMTINGPAPIILAMFLNTAVDQELNRFREEKGREPTPDEAGEIEAGVLKTVRGTVQADILKEDQGQNTCIFSTEFALRLMGDVQQYFIDHGVRNYYSVSISGYHIAEAGANPISQLAFTLANAFTYVEYFVSRGMAIDQFAPNLSFFFSNGLDPEYTVIGRVARRIWATVIKRKYGGNERSQKLKYHIQTSGRSLHAQEVSFNDIRTTLQALLAIYDNCNSLHTNAYDEAITTPTEASVRRAMAIQLIITKELGLAKNENPLQGAFIVEELTDLVEEAVLSEFERINARGGVLGAMENQYQRSKIQEESLYYETLKHSGQLPIIGVNTFLGEGEPSEAEYQLSRATEEEKKSQIEHVRQFRQKHRKEAEAALNRLKQVAKEGGNIFRELRKTVRVASLGQITRALYEVGGKYRRNL